MIRNYLITAWRNISRNKLYTLINVLGLSLGVSACLIIYLITSFELNYDTFHPDKERIYRIVTHLQFKEGDASDIAGGITILPSRLRTELSGFENVATFCNYFPKVSVPSGGHIAKKFDAPKEGGEASPVIIAEPQYFSIFKYKWLKGEPSTALNGPFKVVLSEQEAHKYFGSIPLDDIMGREIIYNDSLRVAVSGIVKDWNKNTDFAFKDFISFATIPNSFVKNDIDLKNWGMWEFNSQGFVKLAKNVTAAQVEKQFPAFVKAHMTQDSKAKLSLQPINDIHFNNLYQDSYSRQTHLPTLYALMAIAAFILIIAAINFINLSTAQSLRRAKEVGVRKALGGSKASLTFQFLIETFAVTVLAVILAIVVTNPIIASFHSLIPKGVKLHLLTPQVLLFLFLLIFITSLLAGFYPARVLSSYLPGLSLKGQGSPNLNRKSYLRKTLIIFQFTVSLIFIIGTMVIGSQLHFILNKDLGFNRDAIVTIPTDYNNKAERVLVFANKLKEIPGITLISRHQQTPASQRHSGTIINVKGAGGAKINASFDLCDENYLPLFGLRLLAGRNIAHSDTLKEFLINETCAKALGFIKPEDAVGKLLTTGIGGYTCPVSGVVKDFHSQSLHDPIVPFFMGSLSRNERSISLKLATQGKQAVDFKKTISRVEIAWKQVYPEDKFEYHFFDDTIAAMYDKEQKTSQLMNTAMLIAIFISCMGLFGLATFTAQQRLKEISIRKVLGASVSGIVTMLSRDFLILVVIALLIASPIAYYFMHQWLQNFAYRVDISWWIFVLSGSGAILIALLTISFQSIKAALCNPVKSLKSE
ncbi:ABC transporter permease [Mucilaginibacter gotjawali]|uniref:Macrolide export ATP-binding/permease protein MacB n=2 Tax=Mucilaginibacter gotjawali TaxID=1550579 RepID=A0A0X8X272_9SPHI|nr:ABC transporter permease [Mucilaginibacter gotjawali]MBB3054127.1 ABC-type antimicrobial peptide transport system permease subunit [Mucilaginibacter gotjawali]BAU54396.1 Macrolide export ATP-binding/permease protein MacB [Mucilaginibacter gotjawali]